MHHCRVGVRFVMASQHEALCLRLIVYAILMNLSYWARYLRCKLLLQVPTVYQYICFWIKTAVAYINKCGGTQSLSLSSISAKIVDWCEFRRITLLANHLPGILNSVADLEFRSYLYASDWMLLVDKFKLLQEIWLMDVDSFAVVWNRQLPQFVSWIPLPNASAVKAFSLRLTDIHAYAFSPFTLIPRCLSKIKRERATLVLICPLWPAQTWFPLFLEMSVDLPRIFRSHPLLLHSSKFLPHPLLKSGKFLLSAWILSDITTKSEAFRLKLSSCYWPAPVPLQQLPISPPETIGYVGTWNGVTIPCKTL